MTMKFTVSFRDWTSYRVTVEAESAEDALALMQAEDPGELMARAEIMDFGQDEWSAWDRTHRHRAKAEPIAFHLSGDRS